ncbi:hypothetical protein O181_076782 [Austropuccinia psidii MF-1]|uniref:Uncharacterized protein n=1 Tax=Austropuccinia psidii MF-1 TaxID=1389203 RepID=A0A9Q3FEX7_9BASI|nr:hypothetical protein [Austropuccinia psidii MF-1]
MEIDRIKNLGLSEWEAGSGTSDNTQSKPEETEASILAIRSSELHNKSFSSVTMTFAKHKQCSRFLQVLPQKYRRSELESQLEEPWLGEYNKNKSFLMGGLLYHREKKTSFLTVIDRDHIPLILQ